MIKYLESALWAFYNSNDFEEGDLLPVNLGNDADTLMFRKIELTMK